MRLDEDGHPYRTCGTMQVFERLLEEDPRFRMREAELEDAMQRLVGSRTEGQEYIRQIRCVVHVVYHDEAENIPVEQIYSQIVVLNDDFGSTNFDVEKTPEVWRPLVIDSGIRFILADIDPYGAPTVGITRTETSVPEFESDDAVKFTSRGGRDAWPSDRYLNIWVCPLGRGLLGYAQFPEGPSATDGVVLLHSAFGSNGTAASPYDLGRTSTHEVGHWLGLRHIWGDANNCSGSDFVADTPNQQLPNFRAPSFPHISCSNGPNGDMFMNYMDYVRDAEMYMFTSGQVLRMNAVLEGARSEVFDQIMPDDGGC
ncbi:zinc metalloprotease [bacterium]|nr:MAG: zinc metalloprotease [bacterium]